jgi:hypothetical protein
MFYSYYFYSNNSFCYTVSKEVGELHDHIIYLENFILEYIDLFNKNNIKGVYNPINLVKFTLETDICKLNLYIDYLEKILLKYRLLLQFNNIKYRDDPKPTSIPGIWSEGKTLYTYKTKQVKYSINNVIEVSNLPMEPIVLNDLNECNLPMEPIVLNELNECNLPMEPLEVQYASNIDEPIEKEYKVFTSSIEKIPLNIKPKKPKKQNKKSKKSIKILKYIYPRLSNPFKMLKFNTPKTIDRTSKKIKFERINNSSKKFKKKQL